VQEETNKLKAKSEQINKDQQLYNKL
jgi:intraflagellar transport protein 74